jgi:hypothetical protein
VEGEIPGMAVTADVIPLSPIDQVFTGRGAYPLEFVFAYGGRIDPDRLRESLRRTLALFPAAGSRLVRVAGEAWGLEPSPEGCVFEVGASAATFADAAERVSFVDPVETVAGQPLARIRLTHTPDGSVLGLAFSHAVVDGFSYFYFLSAWSLLFHGRDVPPPCLDRRLLLPDDGQRETAGPSGPGPTGSLLMNMPSPRPSPRAGPQDLEPRECLRRQVMAQGDPRVTRVVRLGMTGLFLDERRSEIPRGRLRWTRREFTRAELSELLGEAQRDCPVRLSHNDVVAAWLWRAHVPEWAPDGEATAFLSCPVDARRLLPGFPPTYFGCAVALANASIERERLAGAPLADLARRVRDAVAGVDGARVRQALAGIDGLRRREGLAALERLHVVHPRAGLLVTNLSRLPVREIVFDSGPPVAFDILAPAERCAVVLPSADGLDVRVCLPVRSG